MKAPSPRRLGAAALASALERLCLRLVLGLTTLVVAYPLLWNLVASLKSNAEILDDPWGLPSRLEFANYARAFRGARMGDYLANSLLVTAGSLALLLFLALTTSYALTRFRKRSICAAGRGVYLAGIFIQAPLLLVPLFLLMNSLKLVDSRLGLVLVYAVGQLPFSVYLLSNYLSSVPRDYEESAFIDGAGRFRVLFGVVAPLAKGGLIAVTTFQFFAFWNEYPLAFSLIFSDSKRTLPVGLANLMEVQRYATDWGALFAGLAIVLAPTLVVYAFAQKRLTEGIMAGGLKG